MAAWALRPAPPGGAPPLGRRAARAQGPPLPAAARGAYVVAAGVAGRGARGGGGGRPAGTPQRSQQRRPLPAPPLQRQLAPPPQPPPQPREQPGGPARQQAPLAEPPPPADGDAAGDAPAWPRRPATARDEAVRQVGPAARPPPPPAPPAQEAQTRSAAAFCNHLSASNPPPRSCCASRRRAPIRASSAALRAAAARCASRARGRRRRAGAPAPRRRRKRRQRRMGGWRAPPAPRTCGRRWPTWTQGGGHCMGARGVGGERRPHRTPRDTPAAARQCRQRRAAAHSCVPSAPPVPPDQGPAAGEGAGGGRHPLARAPGLPHQPALGPPRGGLRGDDAHGAAPWGAGFAKQSANGMQRGARGKPAAGGGAVATRRAPFHPPTRHQPTPCSASQVLRLGLYELVFLEVPSHAINEHVELAKTWVRPQAAGLANAVLRSAARALDAGTLLDPVGRRAGGRAERLRGAVEHGAALHGSAARRARPATHCAPLRPPAAAGQGAAPGWQQRARPGAPPGARPQPPHVDGVALAQALRARRRGGADGAQ
jgi:hypothetical protein